jgi:hypothetical protein
MLRSAELDAISAENKAKGRRIGRNDHLSWLSRLGMASGNSVAKEILNKAGVSKADKTQYQVTECSIHFEHPRIELPILDKVTASIYVRLQPDTEQNQVSTTPTITSGLHAMYSADTILQEIASDVPTASLQPVLIKAELEPHGLTWAVKETMVSVWPEKSDKPGLDSKVWKTLDTTSK